MKWAVALGKGNAMREKTSPGLSPEAIHATVSRLHPQLPVVQGPGDENQGQSASEHRAFRLLQQLIEEDPTLMPEHREDLRKSGLTDRTIARLDPKFLDETVHKT